MTKNDNLKFYWKKGKVDRLRGHTNVEKTETIEKKARGNWKDDTNLMKIRNTREKDDRKKHRKYHTFYLKNMTNFATFQEIYLSVIIFLYIPFCVMFSSYFFLGKTRLSSGEVFSILTSSRIFYPTQFNSHYKVREVFQIYFFRIYQKHFWDYCTS